MSMKQKVVLFLNGVLLPISMMPAEVTTLTKVEKALYFLRSPFLIFIERESIWSLLIGLCILAIAIGIESYTIHCLLQKKCTFIVPRMIFINVIEQLVQNLVFLAMVVAVFMMSCTWHIIVSQIFELLSVFVVFYIRIMISTQMFAWFDPLIDRIKLRKAMLLANGLSYLFLLVAVNQ